MPPSRRLGRSLSRGAQRYPALNYRNRQASCPVRYRGATAPLVLGQAEVKFVAIRRCTRINSDALRPVQRLGAEEIGGEASLDGNINLRMKAVLQHYRALAEDERHLGHTARRIERALRNKTKETFEIMIIGGIDDHAAIAVGDWRRPS